MESILSASRYVDVYFLKASEVKENIHKLQSVLENQSHCQSKIRVLGTDNDLEFCRCLQNKPSRPELKENLLVSKIEDA